MAQFDVYRADDGAMLLDCQSDLLADLNTRFVVPLIAEQDGPLPVKWLNPRLSVGEDRLIMYTQFAASIPARMLGRPVTSLAPDRDSILRALDTLWTGF